MSDSKTTTDHETIRQWVEERNGQPATVEGTGEGGEPGLLRIDFPEREADARLEAIEWDDFFAKFDESGLAFLYQEQTADGSLSRFCKFINKPK
jgi:hypothetical protein